MLKHADAVAECVLKAFDALPAKAKPRRHPNGSREWVPLSGLVISHRRHGQGREYQCVSLGTGMRCLPAAKLPLAQGRCLHDWHAEVVAIRGFNYHLLQECLRLLRGSQTSSIVIQAAQTRAFTIRDDVQLHMYSSEAPCGDASMELIMDAQDDPTPWNVLPLATGSDMYELAGRGYFSLLGRVRRKPARADAPETLSKSCSDKLAMKQCTSLLSSLTSLLIETSGAYLKDLILPASQHSEVATKRAFSSGGRMASLKDADGRLQEWEDGYAYRPFDVESTSLEFAYSRRGGDNPTPSNLATVWTPDLLQVIIGGTLQGHKQFAPKGACAISRTKMWELCRELASHIEDGSVSSQLNSHTYDALKAGALLDARRRAKEAVRAVALRPWTRNTGDSSFSLDFS